MKIIINAVIGSLIIGYFFGCINFSYIVSRIKGFDIRKFGSGNAGASNVVIVIGKKAGLFVALVDIFKAFLAYKLAQYLFPDSYLNGVSYAGMIAGVGAVLGHIFPFYLGFKGGKGLACYGGTILAIDYRLFIVLFLLALFIAVITDYICFAPITMAFIAPIAVGVIYSAWILAGILAVAGMAMLYKHGQNLQRIRAGNELRFHFLWRRDDESERFGIVDDGKDIFNREVTK